MTIAFAVLFCSVLVWLFLCYRIFKILETRHPETYKSIGEPSLIWNNSLKSNFLFFRFFFRRGWKDLEDDGLSRLGDAMVVFLVLYLVLYALLAGGILAASPG